MKKLKTTFKGLLLAAVLLLGGASSAWAGDVTTLYGRGTSAEPANSITAWSDTDITDWSATDKLDYDNAGNGFGSDGYNNFDLSTTFTSPSANTLITYTIDWYITCQGYTSYSNTLTLGSDIKLKTDNSNIELTVNGVTKSHACTSAQLVNINITINTAINCITALSITQNESELFKLSDLTTAESYLSDSPTFNQLKLAKSLKNQINARAISNRLKRVLIQQETQDLTKYGYTIKYCTDPSNVASTTVKTIDMTAEEDKVYDGTRINAETTPFTVSSTKYLVTNDATTSFIIDSYNKECIVMVRKADTWNWTLKGNCGGDLVDIDTGTVVEGETVSNTPFLNMLLHDGKLYKKDAISHNFEVSFTPTSDDYVQTYDYTLQDYSNVILLKEAENIATLTVPASDNYYLKERLSGKAGAYAASDAVVCTLPAGTYKMSARVVKNGGNYVFFYGDNTTVLTATEGTITTGSEFTLTASTEIKVKQNTKKSNSGDYCCLDYIFIEQTAVNVPNSDALGYTFSSTLPLDFSGTSVRAYIATYTSEKNVVKLTQKTKVPANTGVLIFSNSNLTNQSIPTTTASTDNVDGNKLVAVSEAMTLGAAGEGYENYVLVIEGGKPVFQKIGATSASMSAGQAYLQIPARTGSGGSARTIRVVFDDEDQTTGIKNLTPTLSESERVVYNLQGRRVTQPTKGLYIVNGKKVVIK